MDGTFGNESTKKACSYEPVLKWMDNAIIHGKVKQQLIERVERP